MDGKVAKVSRFPAFSFFRSFLLFLLRPWPPSREEVCAFLALCGRQFPAFFARCIIKIELLGGIRVFVVDTRLAPFEPVASFP
jgi:hypothetical protein